MNEHDEPQDARADDPPERAAIWSIRYKRWKAYIALFTGLTIASVVAVVLHLIDTGSQNTFVYNVILFGRYTAPLIMCNAGISFGLVETGEYAVVLADDLRQRLARRRQRQIDEAVAKARAAVKTEFERRERQREAQRERREQQREQQLERQTRLYSSELDAWMSRRLAAERNGEPFSEPMPNLADYLRLGNDNANGA